MTVVCPIQRLLELLILKIGVAILINQHECVCNLTIYFQGILYSIYNIMNIGYQYNHVVDGYTASLLFFREITTNEMFVTKS